MVQETRQIVIDRAHELFNEHGLHAVGVRDLARDLGLSPGNVSYYFARKENLIEALMEEFRTKNRENMRQLQEATSLIDLLTMYRHVFLTQYEYRFLARAIIDIIEEYPRVAENYAATDRERTRDLTQSFQRMVGQDLSPDTDAGMISAIVATCTLTARFWLSEAKLSFNEVDPTTVVDHYLALIAHALRPAATPQAREQLQPFLEGIIPATSR